MMPIVIVLALGALMQASRSFRLGEAPGSAGTALSFGYMLLTAYLVGGLFARVRLPKLTGYIATGIVVGPGVLGLLSERVVGDLQLFTGVAVVLIALTAGMEIELRAMRPLFRSIGSITLIAVGGTVLPLTAVIYGFKSQLAFLSDLRSGQALMISVVLAVVMVAKSPAVVVALRKETNADGPLTRTVLGVVVLGDLAVVVAFAVATSLAKSLFGQSADLKAMAVLLGWQLLGSLFAGVVIGLLLAVYLRRVRGGAALFILTVTLVVAEVGGRLQLDPMLIALAAGVLIRNATDAGRALHDAIEKSSLPVYVIFFAVAGAGIHLDVLASVGPLAALFVVVRGAGFLIGSRFAARLAGAPPAVERFAGFGLLPQAGLALALAMLFAEAFPELGADAAALTLAVVAINEMVAPALYRIALVRSGEAGRLSTAKEPAASPVEAGVAARESPAGADR